MLAPANTPSPHDHRCSRTRASRGLRICVSGHPAFAGRARVGEYHRPVRIPGWRCHGAAVGSLRFPRPRKSSPFGVCGVAGPGVAETSRLTGSGYGIHPSVHFAAHGNRARDAVQLDSDYSEAVVPGFIPNFLISLCSSECFLFCWVALWNPMLLNCMLLLLTSLGR
ncbi:hypothetical protein DFH08DRAFT_940628 [Mycena albidolilacea]|uniref:Uncharacterized protein n=1 Tax=Mycena albidolilacea TaxID=1033008 RepID=A0AAD7EIQ0_9AGAR|nr:hypothetical protein DFH08DRAFT_940628 [Mycena albidolilacea]